MRDTVYPDLDYATQNLTIDAQTGGTCLDSENNEACHDYEVRFCCEGCCPKLNVSGNPQLTEYYENYPGIYELQENDLFNDAITYKQISGYDEAGNTVYGEGIIYYWQDVGWLLGANTFTYSYYSDGIGERCPQFAPKNWTNEVYGTQLNVECIPIYPSCNDVECVENAYCQMLEDGPTCVCLDGYEKFEDGQCLKPEPGPEEEDGTCGPNGVWSAWMNSDDPSFGGDWETLGGFDQSDVCQNPEAIQARRVDNSTNPLLITHISKELGFWCVDAEQQSGDHCVDYEVRFCCTKFVAGECDLENYEWGNKKLFFIIL